MACNPWGIFRAYPERAFGCSGESRTGLNLVQVQKWSFALEKTPLLDLGIELKAKIRVLKLIACGFEFLVRDSHVVRPFAGAGGVPGDRRHVVSLADPVDKFPRGEHFILHDVVDACEAMVLSKVDDSNNVIPMNPVTALGTSAGTDGPSGAAIYLLQFTVRPIDTP
jgi:hypothetical protein